MGRIKKLSMIDDEDRIEKLGSATKQRPRANEYGFLFSIFSIIKTKGTKITDLACVVLFSAFSRNQFALRTCTFLKFARTYDCVWSIENEIQFRDL